VAAAAAPGETLSAAAGGNFTSVRLLISHNLMGTVIGRQGLKIKHIQDVSGARMVASKEMLPQSTERIVEVQGTFEAIRVAVLEIAKCLLEDWERGQGTVLYHPGQAEGAGVLAIGGAGGLQPQGTPNRRAGGGAYLAGAVASMTLGAGGSHGMAASPPQPRRAGSGEGAAANGSGASARRTSTAAADAAASGAAVTPAGGLVAGASDAAGLGAPIVDAANQRTQNISIPSDMVGCIIGKGGSKITEIRRISGSRISIAKVPHDDSGERMFTIQGTAEANEKALYLLYNVSVGAWT
jgi:heterogeneous nuclear rnp K-like protein 2